jgi:hypothetical protein
MNVGYFTVQPELETGFINWEMLNDQLLVESTKFFKHAQFEKPLMVRMDGKKRISVITLNDGRE